MGCEMATAVGSATVHGGVFFGQNIHHLPPHQLSIKQIPHRLHAPDEMLQLSRVELLQVAQTHAVVGCRSESMWGFEHGLNEHGLAVGCTNWHSKIEGGDGLTGPELVRLTLERAQHVERGLDVLTDLLRHHGQTATHPGASGTIFMLADSQCAYVVETAGEYWAASEIRHVRAACDAALIRQDWQLIAHGLADLVFDKGWLSCDGAKLDFAGALQIESDAVRASMKRWGRATLLLEQNSGHIDASVMRRILSDHYDGTSFEIDPLQPAAEPKSICRHAANDQCEQTVASVYAELPADDTRMPVLWCSIGPACLGAYLPFFPNADVPESLDNLSGRMFAALKRLSTSSEDWTDWRERMESLQTQVDQQADEFLAELKCGADEETNRRCALFTQNHLEQLEYELSLMENEWDVSLQRVAAKEM